MRSHSYCHVGLVKLWSNKFSSLTLPLFNFVRGYLALGVFNSFQGGRGKTIPVFSEHSGVLKNGETIDREQDIIIIMSKGVDGFKWDCTLL